MQNLSEKRETEFWLQGRLNVTNIGFEVLLQDQKCFFIKLKIHS